MKVSQQGLTLVPNSRTQHNRSECPTDWYSATFSRNTV